jgi:adenylosuccinate lyase
MELSSLTAISPVDGRYRLKVDELADYFSEYGLIRYRLMVEIEYFIALCEIPLIQLKDIDKENFQIIRNIYKEFDLKGALRIKEYEKITNHDVKAVEYYIKEKFNETGLSKWIEFIHFGLTSQDINNTAIPLSLKDGMDEVYMPLLLEVREMLASLADEWKEIPMPHQPDLGRRWQYFFPELTNRQNILGRSLSQESLEVQLETSMLMLLLILILTGLLLLTIL